MTRFVTLVCVFLMALTAPVACSRFPLNFATDATYTRADVEVIHAQAEKWNAVTVHQARIAFDGEEWWIANAPPKGDFAGMTYSGEHTIMMASPVTPAGVVHELGHALGLRHTCHWTSTHGPDSPLFNRPCIPNDGAIMNPVGGPAALTINADDLAECRAVGACL